MGKVTEGVYLVYGMASYHCNASHTTNRIIGPTEYNFISISRL